MSTRVQVVLEDQEREQFRYYAQREGLSLSAWMRRAAQEKAATLKQKRMVTAQELARFFADCDDREQGRGREPDWEEHLLVMQQSQRSGSPPS